VGLVVAFFRRVSKDSPVGRLYSAAHLFPVIRVFCIIQGLGAGHLLQAQVAILRMAVAVGRQVEQQADQ
jgi:hypothetical protein